MVCPRLSPDKCQEHLSTQLKNGVSGIIVTHDITAIRQFAAHAAWLHAGCLRTHGSIAEGTLEHYLAHSST